MAVNNGETMSAAARNPARDAWHSAQDLPWRAVGRTGALMRAVLGANTDCPLGMLTYHRIAPPVAGLPYPEHNVAPSRFRTQIEGLLSRGFTVWPLKKVLARRNSGEAIPARTVVLTFDDAYETVYTNAWPVLQELQLPATVFVATSFLDRDDPFPFDDWGTRFSDRAPGESYRPLRRRQCLEMCADGLVEIGAHTHTHQDFHGHPEVFRDDMQTCIRILRDMLGVQDLTFSFPFGRLEAGRAGEELLETARASGVTCGLTTEAECVDPDSDPFTWGRFTAFPFDTGATLAAKLDGWYSWAPQLMRRLLRR